MGDKIDIADAKGQVFLRYANIVARDGKSAIMQQLGGKLADRLPVKR